jgi:hypothetical protein
LFRLFKKKYPDLLFRTRLVRHVSMYFATKATNEESTTTKQENLNLPAPASPPAVVQPEDLDELAGLLLSSVEISAAVVAVAANGEDNKDGLLLTLILLHCRAGSLFHLAHFMAQKEFEQRDISVWRQATPLVALVACALRQDSTLAYCARITSDVIKTLTRPRGPEPDIDALVGRFVGAVRTSFGSDLPPEVAVLLQAVYNVCGDTRSCGLFLFLRFFSPYLTHPARWNSKPPLARQRLTAFARRMGQLVALQKDQFDGSFLEPLLFELTAEGGFYQPVLLRKIPPSARVRKIEMGQLRSFIKANLSQIRSEATQSDIPANLWNLLDGSGKLKRSASWCT